MSRRNKIVNDIMDAIIMAANTRMVKLVKADAAAEPVVAEPEVIREDPRANVPYLYILMRNDLASLNFGKAVAQGSHAANQMVHEAVIKGKSDIDLRNILIEWGMEANGFGTCIVLSVNEEQMRQTIAKAKENGLHAGITHDPTYPLQDGQSFHLIPLDTCAYVFARKADAKPYVSSFSLMP